MIGQYLSYLYVENFLRNLSSTVFSLIWYCCRRRQLGINGWPLHPDPNPNLLDPFLQCPKNPNITLCWDKALGATFFPTSAEPSFQWSLKKAKTDGRKLSAMQKSKKVQTKAKTGRRRRWSRRRIRQKEKVRHPVQRPDRDVMACLLVIAATTTTSARSLSGANIRRIPSLPSTYCSMCSTMNSTNQSGRNEALVDGMGIVFLCCMLISSDSVVNLWQTERAWTHNLDIGFRWISGYF